MLKDTIANARQGHQKNTALALAVVKLYLSVQVSGKKGNETYKQIDRDFHPHPHLNQSVDQFNVLDILDQILSK